MKSNLLLVIAAVGVSLYACSGETEQENKKTETATTTEVETEMTVSYNVDVQNSVVEWSGNMIGVYGHSGDLSVKGGMITANGTSITGGEFTVDMLSMVTTDSDDLYKMAPREKLIGHLQSDDFFSTGNFPTASFVVTNVSGSDITGDLTIKGVTNSETISDVVVSQEGDKFKGSGTLVFNRQDYGVTYQNTMNDMVLSDDIELKIVISGEAK